MHLEIKYLKVTFNKRVQNLAFTSILVFNGY